MIRDCAACGVRDDHPRHVVGLINVARGTVPPVPLHLDCCAARGCESCAETVRAAGGTGTTLINYLAAQRAARTRD